MNDGTIESDEGRGCARVASCQFEVSFKFRGVISEVLGGRGTRPRSKDFIRQKPQVKIKFSTTDPIARSKEQLDETSDTTIDENSIILNFSRLDTYLVFIVLCPMSRQVAPCFLAMGSVVENLISVQEFSTNEVFERGRRASFDGKPLAKSFV